MAENDYLMLAKVVANEATFFAYLARLTGIAILVAIVAWIAYCRLGNANK